MEISWNFVSPKKWEPWKPMKMRTFVSYSHLLDNLTVLENSSTLH